MGLRWKQKPVFGTDREKFLLKRLEREALGAIDHDEEVLPVNQPFFVYAINLAEKPLRSIPPDAAFEAMLETNAQTTVRELVRQNSDGEETAFSPHAGVPDGPEPRRVPESFTRAERRID